MKIKLRKTRVAVMVLLVAAATARAQSPAQYYNEMKSLNPVGYWPMHETNAPAPGDTETNYGSLGLLGTGYYPDWEPGPSGSGFLHQAVLGPISNAPNRCLSFLYSVNTGSGFNSAWFTNDLFIPRVSPLLALNTNWTVECWIHNNNGVPQGAGYKGVEMWGEFGFDNLNFCGTAGGGGDGLSLNWNGSWFAQAYDQYNAGVTFGNNTLGPTNQWMYIVVTCDGNTNLNTYYNGNILDQPSSGVGKFLPDTWTPFTIGGARGGTRSFAGWCADFAIYTNALGLNDLSQKYADASSTNGAAYFIDVSNDQPVVFYKMDSPAYNPPPLSAWPALYNAATTNGVAVGNGVYTPGTVPGILSGPFNPNGFPYGGVTNKVVMLSGISSYADAGNVSTYNVTGSNANFSVTAMFRGNPCDGRFNSIVSHGTNSWQLAVSTNGVIVFNAGNAGTYGFNQGGTGASPGDMRTVGVYNDANWHEVVAVNQTNRISIYVDGVLDTNGTPAGIATTNVIPGNQNDVMIGADPSYTNFPVGVGRQFAGQICEVAFFTNALTAAQAQALYNASGIPPYVTTQPLSQNISAGIAYTNTITAGGNTPLYYQWYTNGVAFGGQTNASVILNPATASDAGTYYAIVTNSYGSATSAVATLTIYTAPTVFGDFPVTHNTQQNTNFFTVYAGANPNFSISALGQSLAYYWYTNGVQDAAATNYNFTWPNAQLGSFTVYGVVSNFLNSVTSAVWSASVVADPATNGPGYAPYPQAVLALHPIGYWRLNEADNGNGDDGVIATDYASGNNGIYNNVVLGTPGYNPTTDPSDTSVQVGTWYVNDCDAATIGGSIGNGVDFATPAGSNAEFSVECWAYFLQTNKNCGIVSKGWSEGGEEFAICSTNNGANPSFVVRTYGGVPYAAGSGFTPQVNTWYHFCGVCDEANGKLSFYVNGVLTGQSSIPSHTGILDDSARGMVIGAEPSGPATVNDLQAQAQINDVAVFNYALTASQVVGQYTEAAFPPFIGQQPPALAYAGRGSSPSIPVGVTGSVPMTDVWYETNVITHTITPILTNLITSSASSITSLTIANIINSDSWFLTISNAFGVTNTSVASIVVYSNPLVTAEFPITYTNIGNTNFLRLYPGANPKFSVSALGLVTGTTGATTNSYQWFVNGTAATLLTQSPTAIGTTYAMSNVLNSFNIYLVMGNSFGATTSAVWSAAVVSSPHSLGGGTALYPQQVMALNPVDYWRLNEADDGLNDGNPGAVAYDYASGNNGIYTNAILDNTGTNQYSPLLDPTGTSALFGGFNSPNSMVECIGTNVDFTASSTTIQGLTVECWVNWSALSSLALVTKGYIGADEFSMESAYSAGPPASMFPRFDMHTATGDDIHGDGEPVTTNQWYHLVGVCDEANNLTTLYVNGNFAGSFGMGGHEGIYSKSSYNLLIGAASSSLNNASSGLADLQTYGYVSDVAIFNYALTPSQVLNQYLLGGAVGPSFNPTPPTTATGGANETLTIPVTAVGTPSLGYSWLNVTTGAPIGSGTTNTSGILNASLNYPNVPLSWNGDQLELTVTNAYGTANAFVTVTITNTVSLNPISIGTGITNNLLYLHWPADHIGWQLQAQTNLLSVGINTNWVNVSGSTTTNEVIVPFNAANGCVFYRLVYP